jgi:hypothetical protein
MLLSSALIDALVAADFADRYYAICDSVTQDLYRNFSWPGNAAVCARLAALGTAKKIKGNGRVFSLSPSPALAQIDFTFCVYSHGTTCDLVYAQQGFSDTQHGANGAILAASVCEAKGKALRKHPYPRPSFYSLEQLQECIAAGLELARSVDDALVKRIGGQSQS